MILKCPRCKQSMKYYPIKKQVITSKKKKCVYCNKTFPIHKSPTESNVLSLD
jgi:ribosomal protein S27AE